MSKYRTAVIACGIIARVHARGWQGVPGQPTEIGALADTNPDARREYGDFFDVGDEHRSLSCQSRTPRAARITGSTFVRELRPADTPTFLTL